MGVNKGGAIYGKGKGDWASGRPLGKQGLSYL